MKKTLKRAKADGCKREREEENQRKERETTYRQSRTIRLFHWSFNDEGETRVKCRGGFCKRTSTTEIPKTPERGPNQCQPWIWRQ